MGKLTVDSSQLWINRHKGVKRTSFCPHVSAVTLTFPVGGLPITLGEEAGQ